jgi:hypothetical protein
LDMSWVRGCCCGERPPHPGRRLDARLLVSRRRSSAKTAERVRPAGEEEYGEAVGDVGARVSIAMAGEILEEEEFMPSDPTTSLVFRLPPSAALGGEQPGGQDRFGGNKRQTKTNQIV